MVFCLKLDLFTTTTFGGQKFFHKSTLRNCSLTKGVTGKPVKCYDVCWCRQKYPVIHGNFMFATIPDWSCTTTFAGSVPIKRISSIHILSIYWKIYIYISTWQILAADSGRRVFFSRWTKEDATPLCPFFPKNPFGPSRWKGCFLEPVWQRRGVL